MKIIIGRKPLLRGAKLELFTRTAVLLFVVILGITILTQKAMATDVGGIIDTDTTWNLVGSPYNIKSEVQVAEGVTLTIEPGVEVNGEDHYIELWGSINAVGNNTSKIYFTSTSFNAFTSDTSSMIIEHCSFQIGHLYGKNLTLRNCMFPRYDVIVRNSNCFIEKNIFDEGRIVIQSSGGGAIRNNVFIKPITAEGSIYIQSGGSGIAIEYNSFLATDRTMIRLGSVNSDIIAENNFWNSTDIAVIDSMIYDRNDNLGIDGFVDYLPMLNEPHPNTPNPDYNQSPIANAGDDEIVFDEITLNGSLSDDPDGEIVSYQWQISHRENSDYDRTGDNEAPTVFNLKKGFYDVTLTVEDDDGALDTDEMSFSATGLKGDFNFDENVDGSDLAEFAEKFGTSE